MSGVTPVLWFEDNAEEAASFYVSVIPGSVLGEISRYADGSRMPEGTALVVSFTLAGRPYQALNGGVDFPFTEAVSLSIEAADQNEIDRLWDALIADGGAPGQCGWLKDKFGLSWQVVPEDMGVLMQNDDPRASARVFDALMQMTKIDIAALESARSAG